MKTGHLKLETVGSAAPEAAAEWLLLMTAAVQDCRRRPACNKKRTVTLKVDVVPHPNDPDDVIIMPSVGARTPTIQHAAFRARASRNGQLLFDFPDEEEAA